MNLIITCSRHMERDTAEEASELFGKMGDEAFRSRQTGISGIITGDTAMDPVEASVRIREMVAEEPWKVRYMRRIIPVHATVHTGVVEIGDAVRPLVERMEPNQTYRVSVEKRNSTVSGREIIEAVAATIPNTVSLDDPDIIVQVEVLGGITGISLIRPGDIFSLDIAKRVVSED